MTAEEPRPRRELVTGGPRAGRVPAPRGSAPAPPPAEPADPAVSALIRRQLRTSLTAAAALVLLIALLPLLFAVAPGLAGSSIAGVNTVWVVLGVLSYPVLWLIGRWYVARAEANESRPPDDGAAGTTG
ncbi:uncharacterized membrane protein (DUF485 family) [Kitasatospora sp. GAS204A]|uniref:DUF485 domain-containing protein n=1 Tax=unclassified Kitasatospora TaxID=2633591 RepID=UPI002473E012|nr:DUF485 domain-containing protein [Kitasatospora sp. GAS204B]MDH6116797.1 uncharacterized membrane protein (DUF485 family) [Kitasatospora sp. GAS204B]